MTPDEVLAVIRERVKWWRGELSNHKSPNCILVGGAAAGYLLDDLDPDRIDQHHKLSEELRHDIREIANIDLWPHMANVLIKKGWRK